jgi:uncharacterized membrane protein
MVSHFFADNNSSLIKLRQQNFNEKSEYKIITIFNIIIILIIIFSIIIIIFIIIIIIIFIFSCEIYDHYTFRLGFISSLPQFIWD